MKRISQAWRQEHGGAGRQTTDTIGTLFSEDVKVRRSATNPPQGSVQIRSQKNGRNQQQTKAKKPSDDEGSKMTKSSDAGGYRTNSLAEYQQTNQIHSSPPRVRIRGGAGPSLAPTAVPNAPTSQQSSRFDANIETGFLSTRWNKFSDDDLDLSKAFASPLQVSTPASTGLESRVTGKRTRFSDVPECPLINSVHSTSSSQSTPNIPVLHSSCNGAVPTGRKSEPMETDTVINDPTAVTEKPGAGGLLQLSSWGLPDEVTACYSAMGITSMFQWQAECLRLPGVLAGSNLVYSAPTSAGKTLVAELLVLKRVLETRRKAVLILPFVSVAREKMTNLQNLFSTVGIRVDGFIGGTNPVGGFTAVDVAVCTIEKANGLINRLLDNGTISTIGTVVVDELHMVGDAHRGYLLELLLTKIRFMTPRPPDKQCKPGVVNTDDSGVQIVGMSATLPNLDLLGRWLDAAVYTTDFRPVPLTECLKVGTTIYNNTMIKMHDLVLYRACPLKGDEDHVVSLCLETMSGGHSVLIFCPTKNWCEKLALNLANNFFHIVRAFKGGGTPPVVLGKLALQDIIEQLRRTPVGLDAMLAQLVPHGVAFHHAGLTFDERDIIEGGFRNGALRVLVATSTLSSGVNLPARRVLIRTPKFHGQTIDTLTYKQMVGRAGRKGVDTEGESVLLCKQVEKDQGHRLMSAHLPPVASCLLRQGEQLSSSMKRAILEVVVSGVAQTPGDVERYASCTLLAASSPSIDSVTGVTSCSQTVIKHCIQFLSDSEFVILRKDKDPGVCEVGERYEPTQLGRAVLASALSPDEGLIVFAELQRARKSFVLENELHILYQVTPIYQVWTAIDWYQYLCTWEALPADQRRVAECVGVSEAFLTRAVQGRVASSTAAQQRVLAIHRRFYTALVLQDLIQEVPLPFVADKYRCTRGVLQSLQQSSATFSGMVTAFCSQLGWTSLELLLSQFQARVTFGVQRELIDLVRVSLLNGHRARVLFNAGFQTVSTLANAPAEDIEQLLRKAVPFQSMKKGQGESDWELAERRKVRCIWVTGQKGLSEREAAVVIIKEARRLVEQDLGVGNIQWKPCEQTPADTENKKDDKTYNIIPKTNTPNTSVVRTKEHRVIKIPMYEDDKDEIVHIANKSKEWVIPAPKTVEPIHVKTSGPAMDAEIKITDKENSCPTVLRPDCVVGTKTRMVDKKAGDAGNAKVVINQAQNASWGDFSNQISSARHGSLRQEKTPFLKVPLLPDVKAETESSDSYMAVKQECSDPRDKGPKNPQHTPPATQRPPVAAPMTAHIAESSLEMDVFSDSFELDTQLVNLMSDTSALSSTKRQLSSSCQTEQSKHFSHLKESDTQPVSITKALEAKKEGSHSAVVSVQGESMPTDITPVRTAATGSKSPCAPLPAGVDSGKPSATSGELTLQLDLSNDEDLELFMDQYSTQLVEVAGQRSRSPGNTLVKLRPDCKLFPVRMNHCDTSSVSASSISRQYSTTSAQDKTSAPILALKPSEKNTVVVNSPTENIQSSSEMVGADLNRSTADDLWSTGDELALCSSFTDSPKLVNASKYAHMSSFNAVLSYDDPSPMRDRVLAEHMKPTKTMMSPRNVSAHTEELAYMSLYSDSSALLELEDMEVPDEAQDHDKALQDLSAYFAENFGSFGAALDDSWNLSHSKRDVGAIEQDQGQRAGASDMKPVELGPTLKGDAKLTLSLNSVEAPEKAGSLNVPHDCKTGKVPPEKNGRKRKVDEAVGCTPHKVTKMGEAEQESGGKSKTENNTSDCVPPTPPDPQAIAPRTQSRKSGKTTTRQKKSTKTPVQRSKRKKDSALPATCVAQLNNPDPNLKANSYCIGDVDLRATHAELDHGKKPALSLLLPDDSPINEESCSRHTTGSSALILNMSLNQSIPLTNEHFAIIDVAANKELFDHFVAEWRGKSSYAVCFACEKLNQRRAPGMSGIGTNFVNKRAPPPLPGAAARGLVLADAGLQVVGMAISWVHKDVYYISFTTDNDTADPDDSLAPPPLDPRLPVSDRLQTIRSMLATGRCMVTGESVMRVMFDAREQYKVYTLACEGNMVGAFQDPKVALWMLDPGAKEQSLHRMVHNRLPLDDGLLEGMGGGMGLSSLGLNPDNPGSGRLRACTEAVLVSALMTSLSDDLTAHGLHSSFTEVEMPSQIILACMELNGFGFSEEECARQKEVLDAKLATLEETAYCLAGHTFSLSSPDDIAQVLYIELKLPPSGDPLNPGAGCKTLGPSRRGRGGGRGGRCLPFSTSKDILEKLRLLHPLPAALLEWRRLTAALTKVVFPLTKDKVYCPRLEMYRIHALCQTHTATGRVSMAEPNLQNIPKDFDIDVAGGILVAADYSQLELRMIAHLSHDRRLINILNEGRDVFRLIAAGWKGVEVEAVTAVQRAQAKQVCYGMLYGIGARALGEQLGVPQDDAAVFVESFKAKYTGMRSFLRECVNTCREKGHVQTLLGRRRYLPSIKDTNMHARAHAERQAVNTTVQGSAADLVKKAMVLIEERLTREFSTSLPSHRHHRLKTTVPPRAYLLLQLHDELIYEVPISHIRAAATIIQDSMENAMRLSVRMPVKLQAGPTWGTLEELKL